MINATKSTLSFTGKSSEARAELESNSITRSTGKRILATRHLYAAIIVLASIAIVLPIVSRSRAQDLPLKGPRVQGPPAQAKPKKEKFRNLEAQIVSHADELLEDGRQVFRSNTFGDENFWGDTLQLHKPIEGAALGGRSEEPT